MIYKKSALIILCISLLGISALVNERRVTFAQNLNQSTLPSDLNLDLNQAKQNPAPDQQALLQSETQQAQFVTNTGDTTLLKPQDFVAPQVQIEKPKDVVHPQETASEQVVSTSVIIEQQINQPQSTDINNNGSPTPNQQGQTGNSGVNQTTPTVTQTDDNTAPTDNSTNPNLPAPTTASQQIQPTSSSSDISQPSSRTIDNNPQQLNTIPTNNPGTNAQPTSSANNAGTNSQPVQQDNGTTPQGSTDVYTPPPSEDGTVQGATTGPLSIVQKIVSKISNILFFWLK